MLGFKIILGLHCLHAQTKPINNGKPFTVCQVLQDFPSYNGKVIEVRGQWHGSYLEGFCEIKIRAGDHIWPNQILLTSPGSLDIGEEPVDWEFSNDAYSALFLDSVRHFKVPLYATIVGRFDARPKLSADPRSGSLTVPFGYGHLNYYPARLIKIAVKDIAGSGLRESNEEIKIEPPVDD